MPAMISNEARKQFTELLVNRIKSLVEGAEADIQMYGTAIATDAISAATEEDPTIAGTLLSELGAQATALLEVNRIKVNHERINTLQDSVKFAAEILRAALIRV